MTILIATLHEIAVNYELKLKPQLTCLDISGNHNVESMRYLYFKI